MLRSTCASSRRSLEVLWIDERFSLHLFLQNRNLDCTAVNLMTDKTQVWRKDSSCTVQMSSESRRYWSVCLCACEAGWVALWLVSSLADWWHIKVKDASHTCAPEPHGSRTQADEELHSARYHTCTHTRHTHTHAHKFSLKWSISCTILLPNI